MVGDVSWEQRERGEEKERTDATGESLAAASAGAIGMGGQPEQEEQSGGAVPAAGGKARKEACFDGCKAFDTGDFLSPAQRVARVPRPGSQLSGPVGRQGLIRYHIKRLESLGHTVTLSAHPA